MVLDRGRKHVAVNGGPDNPRMQYQTEKESKVLVLDLRKESLSNEVRIRFIWKTNRGSKNKLKASKKMVDSEGWLKFKNTKINDYGKCGRQKMIQ